MNPVKYKKGLTIGYDIALRYALLFNTLRNVGNYSIVNGIGTSNKSLSAIMMFITLYIGFGKYVRQKDILE